MKESEKEKYNELAFYTLSHSGSDFIHQHIVDAYTAQNANQDTTPTALTFALIGLYLYVEKNFSGKEIQKAHQELAKKKKEWPVFELPSRRGEITVFDVMEAKPGKERDAMIGKWGVSVWTAYCDSHEKVARLWNER